MSGKAIEVIMDQDPVAPWVEQARAQLNKEGAVQIVFRCVPSRFELRREVYRYFRSHEIGFNWFIDDDLEALCGRVLITSERVRTEASEVPLRLINADTGTFNEVAGGSLATQGSVAITPGTQERRVGQVPSGFAAEAELAVGDSNGFRFCPVCRQWHPEEQFSWRPGKRLRQSYCKRCNRLYAKWRYEFLKEHNAETLVDLYTQGRRQPNPYFQTWIKRVLEDPFA